MKYLFLYLPALCLLAAAPAFAQGYYNEDSAPAAASANSAIPQAEVPTSHSFIVTSIEKCYKQLGHADALDIQQHFVKPYEECQRRLSIKTQQEHELKAGQQKKPPPAQNAPDNPPAVQPLSDQGLYFRVQKNALPPPPPPIDEKAAPAEDKPTRSENNRGR